MKTCKACKYCGADRLDAEALERAARECKRCDGALRYKKRSQDPCSVDGCTRKTNKLGLCYLHAKDPDAPPSRVCGNCGKSVPKERHGPRAACSDGCSRELDLARRSALGCAVPGCTSPLASVGYCKLHLHRYNKWGDVNQTGPECTCVECGSQFFGRQKSNKVCSSKCRSARRSRTADVEKIRQQNRDLRKKNPDRYRENVRHYRAQRRALEVKVVTDKDVARQRNRQRGLCFHCGEPIQQGPRQEHLDHIVPQNRGGRHSIGNLVIACLRCNVSKSDHLLYEWKLNQSTGRPLKRKELN
ncbi:HNH endonuclease [Gordonia phage Yvonnetastic]|uniref:HNH endonuclease n=1 Tax=Gordonia phage Yvonnetastic TaxID=1821566 RepID=A0A142K907_9CAUD|nr:HNH endonuclease [Gordonia phage Yvonnetastic]AMS02590.1 HNH endonuclease [Gordonia phage Yvonnetastic]WKW86022.1 HNH endonuclease [Gordonia Phage JonJames]